MPSPQSRTILLIQAVHWGQRYKQQNGGFENGKGPADGSWLLFVGVSFTALMGRVEYFWLSGAEERLKITAEEIANAHF